MKFSELAASLDQMEATSSRNELVRILSEVYRACSPGELGPITSLIQGRLAPFFEPVEMGLGEKLLITAVAAAYGHPKEEVGKLTRQLGDLGLTAQRLAPPSRRESPPIVEVHERLSQIAAAGGSGSVQAKLDVFAGLLGDLDPVSAKLLVRITLGKLRAQRVAGADLQRIEPFLARLPERPGDEAEVGRAVVSRLEDRPQGPVPFLCERHRVEDSRVSDP